MVWTLFIVYFNGKFIVKWIFLFLAAGKGLSIRIAQNKQDNNDTKLLAAAHPGKVQVKSLDFAHLMGGGILHTKLWVADRKHFYVGSANFDWRSLTQVKEMGVLVEDCPQLAEDMAKVWQVYWMLGGEGKKVPSHFPRDLWTDIGPEQPLPVRDVSGGGGGGVVDTFLSSSPPPFAPNGRSVDIDALVGVIDSARDFVHVAVMDYFPSSLYTRRVEFWPRIDDALRRAAVERGVRVRLLLSKWQHSRPDMRRYLRSLTALDGAQRGRVSVEGRMFEVPAFDPSQAAIPFARVNHNKYMVTESAGYVGTSNWSEDYFVNTGGIGFVFRSRANATDDLRLRLQQVFDRDWQSDYAHPV